MKAKDSFRWHIVDPLGAAFLRRKLNNPDFSVIGNSCFVSYIYHLFGFKYSTPTVGLFIFNADYTNFLENLEHYLNLPLEFIDVSKYEIANTYKIKQGYYPIAQLDDIEIHFLHYKTETEAQLKWNRRKARVNYENLFLFYDKSLLFNKPLSNKHCCVNTRVRWSTESFHCENRTGSSQSQSVCHVLQRSLKPHWYEKTVDRVCKFNWAFWL